MEISQRISVSGMLASQRQLDVVSNNLANANSTGFRRAVAHTTDTGYQGGLTAPVGPGGLDVHLVGIGEGTQLSDITNEFMPGTLQATGNPLDAALQGDESEATPDAGRDAQEHRHLTCRARRL